MNQRRKLGESDFAQRHWCTKGEIAAHFQIGQRTVTRLMQKKILPFSKWRNLVRFDVDACDRAFEFFQVSSVLVASRNEIAAGQLERIWKTKRQIADHFQISERTVTTLMRRRVLPFVKLNRLVRLNLVACDRAFERIKSESVVARWLPRRSG